MGKMMADGFNDETKELLANYTSNPKGELFFKKYCEIEANMRVAKQQYDELANIYTDMMQVAEKAVLWEGFNLVAGSAVYPNPTSAVTGIINDAVWCTADYIDYATDFAANNIFNKACQKMGVDIKIETNGVISDFKSS